MGNEISSSVAALSGSRKITVLPRRGVAFVSATTSDADDETWGQLCQRVVERDYLNSNGALLPLLVHIYPSRRLSTYHLRYGGGRCTVVRVSWSDSGVNSEAPTEDAWVDVNLTLRLGPGQNDVIAQPFQPHEAIAASLGREGAERTTYVDLYYEKIGLDEMDDGSVASPYIVSKEHTHVLCCEEHGHFPGHIDEYNLVTDEIPVLPERCVNYPGGGHRAGGAKGAAAASALPGINASNIDESGIESVQVSLLSPRAAERKRKRDRTNGQSESSKSHVNGSSLFEGTSAKEDKAASSNTTVSQLVSRNIGASAIATAVTGETKEGTPSKGKRAPAQKKASSPTKQSPAAKAAASSKKPAPDDGTSSSASEAESDKEEVAASSKSSHASKKPDSRDESDASSGAKETLPPVAKSPSKKQSPSKKSKLATDVELSPEGKKKKQQIGAQSKLASEKDNAGKGKSEAQGANSANDENESKEPAAGSPAKPKGKQKPMSSAKTRRRFPTGEKHKHIPVEPAGKDFPAGWKKRHIPRASNPNHRDSKYYSPKMDYMFRYKGDALRFAQSMEQANGDEEEAMALYQQIKEAKKPTAAAGKKSGASGGNGADENGSSAQKEGGKTDAKGGKNKRKREANATKKALEEELASESGDDDNGDDDEGTKPPSKKMKANVMTGKLAAEILANKAKASKASPAKANPAEKSAKKKAAVDPNHPKQPPNAFILYSKDSRNRIAKSNPGLKSSEVVRSCVYFPAMPLPSCILEDQTKLILCRFHLLSNIDCQACR